MSSIQSYGRTSVTSILVRGATAAVLTVFTLAAPAFAQNRETASTHVTVADLNLASPYGRETLRRRLAQAARHVCEDGGSHDLTALTIQASCRKDAMDGAMRQAEKMIAAARAKPSAQVAANQPN